VGLLQRADPRAARALAAKAGDMPDEVQTALAACRFYVARRALAGLGPEVLCDAAVATLRADEDDGVAKIVGKWNPTGGAGESARSKGPASGGKESIGQLLALIADDDSLMDLTVDEQVALANHSSVDVPRALARKAPLLSPEAHAALANSRIFTARRTVGAELDPSLIEQLAHDEDEVVRSAIESLRADA
jgi:hypothetical protein